MTRQELNTLIAQSGLKPRHVSAMSKGLISPNQAGQWLKGKGSKAVLVMLWLMCEKRLSELGLSVTTAPKEQAQVTDKQSVKAKNKKSPTEKEVHKVYAQPSGRKMEISAKRYKKEGSKVFFQSKTGLLVADWSPGSTYVLTFTTGQYLVTIDHEKTAGSFEPILLTS